MGVALREQGPRHRQERIEAVSDDVEAHPCAEVESGPAWREAMGPELNPSPYCSQASAFGQGFQAGMRFKAARAAEQREPNRLSPEWLHQLPKVPAQPTTAELVETLLSALGSCRSPVLPKATAALTELARRAGVA